MTSALEDLPISICELFAIDNTYGLWSDVYIDVTDEGNIQVD